MVENIKMYAMAKDPVYIGTGGYTIGRVDNTIVRDPVTRIPKIPGSSVAGTMRFYAALELQKMFKEEYRINPGNRKDIKNINDMLDLDGEADWAKYEDNKWALMKCAGQDDKPNDPVKESFSDVDAKKSGHCGKCMVCKTFGYSKNNKSQQGMAFFSDLNILFFPVHTRYGVRWITSKQMLASLGIAGANKDFPSEDEVFVLKNDPKVKEGTINLGWIHLKYKEANPNLKEYFGDINEMIKGYIDGNIVLVSDTLASQIINSNLEVRTSVSIDPLTGAAKEGALFTSEAIPRGTIFHGDLRLMERPVPNGMPDIEQVEGMLKAAAKYYETLGIGGMVTRGFGRMKVWYEGGVFGGKNA